jgi:hypothetical protein
MRLVAVLCLLVLLALVCGVPGGALAQVGPGGPRPGTAATTSLPAASCVNQVVIGLLPSGQFLCATVTPAMTTGLVPAGVDVNASGVVIATHLPAPLPLAQGGLGLTTGVSGGVPYFSDPTHVASSAVLPLNAPLFGGGPGQPPKTGLLSGTTLELGSILGPHTPGKQLTYDANGNIIASVFDLLPSAVTAVFGRIGDVIAQPGDYTAAQVTNAADVTAANTFTNTLGQSMPALHVLGSVSGRVTILSPVVAGTAVFRLPTGVTDFTIAGGSGQVVKQLTPSGPLSVQTLSFAEVQGTASPAQIPLLQTLTGVVTPAQGGLGWTDTTVSGSTHTLVTLTGPATAGKQATFDALGTLTASAFDVGVSGGGGTGTVQNGQPGMVTYYPGLGTTVGDSGVLAGQLVTASATFTTGHLVQGTGAGRFVSDSGLVAAQVCVQSPLCPGYQASLGFTPENVANKDASTTLGTSSLKYPTQNAVKVYVDTGLATKEGALTWGPGLVKTLSTVSVQSTAPGFLTSGGATDLVAGVSASGKMQVMTNGQLQYTDGALSALLWKGYLTQSDLSWLVNATVCTSDANGGKLTVDSAKRIVCAADISTGGGGGGTITSVFGRTGPAVVAQPGDYTAAQVTNAADVTAANTFTHPSGQTMRQLVLLGSVSGILTLKSASVSAVSQMTFPAGTTDFSISGGPKQVVRQQSIGGALDVGQLAATDLSNGTTGSGALVLATNPSIVALANLTTNGVVRTTGNNGTLIVDPASYITSNQPITLTGDVTGVGTTSLVTSVIRINGTTFAGAAGHLVSFGAGNTPADSGLTAAQVPTAAAVFTTGHLIQAAGNDRTLSDSGLVPSQVCLQSPICPGYQASLGFTPLAATRVLTIQGTINQVTVTPSVGQDLSANRTWTISLPQNLDTGATVRHASLGLNVVPPTGAGQLAITAATNSVTLLALKRATDVLPFGNFEDFQTAAGASLWRVDITGTLAAGTVPGGLVAGNIAGQAGTALALAATPLPCGGALFGKSMTAAGVWTCVQPTFTDIAGVLSAAQLPAVSTPGVVPLTDAATVTPNAATTRLGYLTSLSQNTLFANPTGTPQEGQSLSIRIVSSTLRQVTWGTDYNAGFGIPLPTATTGGSVMDEFGFQFGAGKWQLIATTQGSAGTGGTGATGVVQLADTATVTPNVATTRLGYLTSLSQNTLFANPIGPPQEGQSLSIRIVSTAIRQLTWSANYNAGFGIPLPVATTGGSIMDEFGFQFGAGKWQLIATTQGSAVSGAGVVQLTDAATVTPNAATMRLGYLLSLSQNTLFANPTGAPQEGQSLSIRLVSTTIRQVTWGTDYNAGFGIPLPTATTGGSVMDEFGFQFGAGKWQLIATTQGLAAGGTGATGVVQLADTATVTPNVATTRLGYLTSLSQNTFFANPTGTPQEGQSLSLRIVSATIRQVTWGANYNAGFGIPLPTATTGGGVLDEFGFQFGAGKWQLIATTQGSAAGGAGVVQLTDAATVTPNAATTRLGYLTSLSQNTLFASPTGAPQEGQSLSIRIVSSTLRQLTWGTDYNAGFGIPLPLATTGGGVLDEFGFQFAAGKWQLIATTQGSAIGFSGVVQLTDAATVTPNVATTRLGYLLSLSQNTLFANPTGTPQEGQALSIRLVSTVSRQVTWGANYNAGFGLPLPTVTTGGSVMDEFGFQFGAGKWQLIATTQGALSGRRRVCPIIVGKNNGALLVNADLGPNPAQCMVPESATIEEVTIFADTGTPNVIPEKRTTGGGAVNILSAALPTAAGGALACARTTAATGYAGTLCSATLQNTTVLAGDTFGLTSGTAGGTARRMSIFITYILNQ